MITSVTQTSQVHPNQASVATAPPQNAGPQRTSLPQDKVTLSPQAQAHAQQAASADKDHDGDKK